MGFVTLQSNGKVSRGDALLRDMWSTAMHASLDHKDKIKKIWKIKNGIFSKLTQAEKNIFEAWYQALL